MQRCQSCSAPLVSIVCDYCGTRNGVDLRNIQSKVLKGAEETSLDCPACKGTLYIINIGTKKPVNIHQCNTCHGVFLGHNSLKELLENEVDKSQLIQHKKLSKIREHAYHRETDVTYRRCPHCEAFMLRRNYKKRSAIIYDVCKEHGIWLDAGELIGIFEFTRLGGEELAKSSAQRYNYNAWSIFSE